MTEKLKNDEQLRQKPVSAVRQSGPFDIEVSRGWSVSASAKDSVTYKTNTASRLFRQDPANPAAEVFGIDRLDHPASDTLAPMCCKLTWMAAGKHEHGQEPMSR